MPIDHLELARRIKTAREASGKTQEQVAQVLGVSRPTVTQIELGNRAVSSIELQQLADLFGRDIREFFREIFVQDDALAALFRATPGADKAGTVQDEIKRHLSIARELASLENLLEIQHPFGPPPSYEFDQPESRWNAIVQGRATAEKERVRLELGNAPVTDIVELLYSQGIYVGFAALEDGVSGITLNDSEAGSVVIVNEIKQHVDTRKRFSLAHEFCHVLLDRQRMAMISQSEDLELLVEVRANAFAAALLMPEIGVRRYFAGLGKRSANSSSAHVFNEIGQVDVRAHVEPQSQDIRWHEVLLAADHFGVSPQAMLFQLRNLKILSEEERALLAIEVLDKANRKLFEGLQTSAGKNKNNVDGSDIASLFVALAIEAFRREIITLNKLKELFTLIRKQEHLPELLNRIARENKAHRRKHKGDAA